MYRETKTQEEVEINELENKFKTKDVCFNEDVIDIAKVPENEFNKQRESRIRKQLEEALNEALPKGN